MTKRRALRAMPELLAETERLKARIAELEAQLSGWVSVDDPISPPEGKSLHLFNPDWIDEDFNPDGVREGFCGPDNWFSATWFDHQDCYETDNCPPTHWRKLPPPPDQEPIDGD